MGKIFITLLMISIGQSEEKRILIKADYKALREEFRKGFQMRNFLHKF